MHKQITTVFTAVATVCVLSSCTATGVFGQAGQQHETSPTDESRASSASNAGSEPTQTEVPAFHFASGDLVLGDFDYEAIQDSMFDPCEEISEEEFAAAGIKTFGSQHWREGGNVGCGLAGPDFHRGYAIGTTPVTRAHLESTPGAIISSSASDIVPGLLTYRGENPATFGCVAAVDTVRGQFSVSIIQNTQPESLDPLCESAVQIMENLYQL
ncbi:DUF3558 domain-containing protein [Corynebacterium tuscaniense]|uniref:DUF3558 domain-containing protein n=1 Tax=Corynebacterium tuscaniense TaxID=302449 RepID=A0A2N6T3Q7_9CORY|nr:DUF3558 domain-containing protein [Corynebacterium tuscaniense]